MRRAGLRPRRTIRGSHTNEERHDGALMPRSTPTNSNHVAAIESDGGVGAGRSVLRRQLTIGVRASPIQSLLAPERPRSRSALGPISRSVLPVPRLSHTTNGATYFDYHHTDADTLDKVDPKLLQTNATMMAVVAYVLAEMPERLAQ